MKSTIKGSHLLSLGSGNNENGRTPSQAHRMKEMYRNVLSNARKDFFNSVGSYFEGDRQ